MNSLPLKDANVIVEAALAYAKDQNLSPLCIAVLDPGGHTLSLQRADGASMLRPAIATGKAYAALALGIDSRQVASMAIERPNLLAGLSGVSGGRIVPLPGGILISSGGTLLGAVGVTGDTSDNDEACAIHAVKAAGFKVGP
ncbi:GlcG/HbpS family heme-binding protein [Oricola nitratireducens]|uniref:GlcG/HbpS family heme-binding protein n=1 Tax=Oricola nitratireducens TaxID=2775868 RepID=UPI001868FDB7|nr:heme-binding protein [Oricola nitratireducens]